MVTITTVQATDIGVRENFAAVLAGQLISSEDSPVIMVNSIVQGSEGNLGITMAF